MIFDRTGCFEGDGLIGLTSLPRLITLDRLIPSSNGRLRPKVATVLPACLPRPAKQYQFKLGKENWIGGSLGLFTTAKETKYAKPINYNQLIPKSLNFLSDFRFFRVFRGCLFLRTTSPAKSTLIPLPKFCYFQCSTIPQWFMSNVSTHPQTGHSSR